MLGWRSCVVAARDLSYACCVLKHLRALLLAVTLLATAVCETAKADPASAEETASPDVGCQLPVPMLPERAREIADELFARGKRLREQGRLAEGCACLEASNRVAGGRGGTLLTVGLCHEQQGKLAAAYRELRRAAAKARQDGRADREAMTAEHLDVIEPRLSWLTITPPANVEEVSVQVDGELVDADEWGSLPVEVGQHVVAASAAGFRARELTVVAGAAAARLSVRFDALEPDRAVPVAPSHRPASASRSVALIASTETQADERAFRNSGASLRTAALVTGIAGVALSLGAGAWALERRGVVRSHCDAEKQCWGTGASAATTGHALIVVSTAAFVAGGVGFGVWALLPGGPLNLGQSSRAGLSVSGAF